VSLHSKLVTL